MQQGYECASVSASNVMTRPKIQMAPVDLCEVNKMFSAVTTGKHTLS